MNQKGLNHKWNVELLKILQGHVQSIPEDKFDIVGTIRVVIGEYISLHRSKLIYDPVMINRRLAEDLINHVDDGLSNGLSMSVMIGFLELAIFYYLEKVMEDE